MQAPEDSAASGSVYPPEPSGVAPSHHHRWLDSRDIAQSTEDQSTSLQAIGQQASGSSHWQWQVGGAITGTAVVSAGLAMPFTGEQAISIPIGETYFPPAAQTVRDIGNTLSDRQAAQEVAFSQGQGINPYVNAAVGQTAVGQTAVGQTQQVLFTQPTPSRFSPSALANTAPAAAPSAAAPTEGPQLVMNDNGSWSLSYLETTERADTPLSTQAVVNQLIAQNRTQVNCSGSSACRSLDYIQAQLPAARQNAQDLQQQVADFEAQHGQSNLTAYKAVLAERISEITGQKTEMAIELSGTRHYISQIKSRLTTLDVSTDLAEQLLAVDDEYQTHWQKLQQTERQLLEEYSQASIDATALNQIYARYEQQQIELHQAAQSVLGNYLLSSGNQDPNGHSTSSTANGIYIAPAALDLLQSLTVATHQQDVQLLRDRTVRIATDRLQTRHHQLAQNISRYEALQSELNAAQALVAQYEQESTRIAAQVTTAQATAATLVSSPTATASNTTANLSPAFATAEALESKVPEGSIGKTLLGIVIAAGAVAVAAQRRAGDVSEALALEISPRPQPKRFGFLPGQKRIGNPVQPDLLVELLEMTGQLRPAIALPGSASNLEIPIAPSCLRSLASAPANTTPIVSSTEKTNAHQLPAAAQIAESQSGQQSSAADQATEGLATEGLTTENQANQHHAVEDQLTGEIMARELEEIVTQSTPEVRLAKEISQRNLEPAKISLDEIDAFAESAVRWVLNDISRYDNTVSEPARETVSA